MVAEKKILYRHVEVNGSNKKMHQLQFKHLKEQRPNTKIHFLECTYTPFTVTLIVQTLIPVAPTCATFKLAKLDLWVKPTDPSFKTQKPLVLVVSTPSTWKLSIILPQRSLTTQLLYHPATDQNKGAQLRRENGQFQQQEEVPLSASNPSRPGPAILGSHQWGQETVG